MRQNSTHYRVVERGTTSLDASKTRMLALSQCQSTRWTSNRPEAVCTSVVDATILLARAVAWDPMPMGHGAPSPIGDVAAGNQENKRLKAGFQRDSEFAPCSSPPTSKCNRDRTQNSSCTKFPRTRRFVRYSYRLRKSYDDARGRLLHPPRLGLCKYTRA